MSQADSVRRNAAGAPAAPAQPPPEPSFEQALELVEAIVERIERGEVGLEESLVEYERGVELIRRCRGILERTEQRVEELTKRMQSETPGNGGG